MKTVQLFIICFYLFSSASAQTDSITFKVWGSCGMCKNTIEGAAKTSGASYAFWDVESKILAIKFPSSKTSVEKIQKAISKAGYDNEKFTATDAAYNKLPACCKYDRKAEEHADNKACCIKGGKCEEGKACCKKAEGKSDCCSSGTCAKEGGCCAEMKCEKGEVCCKKEGIVASADCCKGGTCSHK